MIDLFIEKPQMMAVYLSYVLFLWFLFISVFASGKYFKQSIFMASIWCFHCCCFLFGLFDPLTYKEMLQILILVDIATMLVLVTDRFISWYSCKIALTVAFAVLCHSMLLLYKTVSSEEIKGLVFGFYTYYDELIATVCVLQLLVTFNNGISSAIKRNFRSPKRLSLRLLFWYGRYLCYMEDRYIHLRQKKRERRT